MGRREALQGVRMANILNRWESAELNQAEAAESLGASERTFRRWTRRYEEEGEAGLLDPRLRQASGKRVPADRAEEGERLYPRALPGLHGQAFPPASHQGPRFPLMADPDSTKSRTQREVEDVILTPAAVARSQTRGANAQNRSSTQPRFIK